MKKIFLIFFFLFSTCELFAQVNIGADGRVHSSSTGGTVTLSNELTIATDTTSRKTGFAFVGGQLYSGNGTYYTITSGLQLDSTRLAFLAKNQTFTGQNKFGSPVAGSSGTWSTQALISDNIVANNLTGLGTANNSVGSGVNFALTTGGGSPTYAHLLQLGASGQLSLWNFNASRNTWVNGNQFLIDGNILMGSDSAAARSYVRSYAQPTGAYLLAGNNLADVTNITTARSNLSAVGYSDTSSMLSPYRRTTTKITNSDLANSTISGVSLGSNLNALSNGYGISTLSYNGSATGSVTVDSTALSTKNNVLNQLNKYTGTTNTTTLGTITTGVWNGTAISNSYLANSTISGVSLGSNLATHSFDATLTNSSGASSYNGSSASTWGINLANSNTWTAPTTFTVSTSTSNNAIRVNATLPTSMSGTTIGSYFNNSTSSNSSQANIGLYTYYSGYSGSSSSVGFESDLNGSGTGNDLKWGTAIVNPLGNLGLNAYSYGTNTGLNLGGNMEAGAGSLNIGVMGKAVQGKNSATNIGVLGMGRNTNTSPIQIGGYFTLRNTAPTYASAALIADNGDQSAPIFMGRLNGTDRIGFDASANLYFKGATSGTVTLATQSAAGTYTLTLPNTAGTNGYGLSTDGSGNLSWSAITTPSSSFYLGTTSIALNRSSASQSLTGISIDGNAGTVTNGAYVNVNNTFTGANNVFGNGSGQVYPIINGGTGTTNGAGLAFQGNGSYESIIGTESMVTGSGALRNLRIQSYSNGITLSASTNLTFIVGSTFATAGVLTNNSSGVISSSNGTGFLKMSSGTISYDNSTYLTTSSAASTYLPLTGGTLTGALSGTSATLSGTTASSSYTTGALVVSGGVGIAGAVYANSTMNVAGYLTASGGAGTSDIRLKTNIVYNPNISILDSIDFIQYNMKDNPNRLRYGNIAQQVEKYYPDLVLTNEQGTKAIMYDDLQNMEINELKERVKALEKAVKQLEILNKMTLNAIKTTQK